MAMNSMSSGRPRVICHMLASIDGRIVTGGWPLSEMERRQYELVHATYNADGWLCGRVTMEQHFAQRSRPEADVACEHHGAPRDFPALPLSASSGVATTCSGCAIVWNGAATNGRRRSICQSARAIVAAAEAHHHAHEA
jgi:2,5-diamino-6-(ribosylamino)-4(3H)-pyrimidinone 5'-phosphate reductase